MDVQGPWKVYALSRLRMHQIVLCTLLAVSTFGNLWQHRVIAQKSLEILTVARSRAAAPASTEPESTQMQHEHHTARARANARVDQLYKEIESLSQMNDHVIMHSSHPREIATKGKDHLPNLSSP